MQEKLLNICCQLIEQNRSTEYFDLAVTLARKAELSIAEITIAGGIIDKHMNTWGDE